MANPPQPSPNPRRVAAGRRNRALRRGLSPAGRERLRHSALLHQPWRRATGPKTPAGKAQVRQNGKRRQSGPISARELRTELNRLQSILATARSARLTALAACNRDASSNIPCIPEE
jgi:hypothetical protein